MEEETKNVCYWADGTWCYPDDLEEWLTFMSDDFGNMEVSLDCDDEDVEIIVCKHVKLNNCEG